jgi:hypothetical protein
MSLAVGIVMYYASCCWSDSNPVVEVCANHFTKINNFLRTRHTTLATDNLAGPRSPI